jgi:hypothetical protein
LYLLEINSIPGELNDEVAVHVNVVAADAVTFILWPDNAWRINLDVPTPLWMTAETGTCWYTIN